MLDVIKANFLSAIFAISLSVAKTDLNMISQRSQRGWHLKNVGRHKCEFPLCDLVVGREDRFEQEFTEISKRVHLKNVGRHKSEFALCDLVV
jgi:hypothetical protein